jgi:hypothetical protein
MALQLSKLLIICLLFSPAPANAGWFAWLWPAAKQQAPAAPPTGVAVPAMDVYGLLAAGGSLLVLLRRRRK